MIAMADQDFTEDIKRTYRVQRRRLAPGEYDQTMPLRGRRGFAYVYGPAWVGVWLNSRRPHASIDALRRDFPWLVLQQVGAGECTFRVPVGDLARMLKRLEACEQRKLSEDQRLDLSERGKVGRFHGTQTPLAHQEATQRGRMVV